MKTAIPEAAPSRHLSLFFSQTIMIFSTIHRLLSSVEPPGVSTFFRSSSLGMRNPLFFHLKSPP